MSLPTDPTGLLSHVPRQHRGVSWKQACIAATTANITIATALNNGDTLDGVTLATGNRVLVKDQSTGSQNGIYVVGVTPIRDFDMDQDQTTDVPAEEVLGAIIYVIAGTANAGTLWKNTNLTTPILGTTSLTFSQIASTGLSDPMTTRGDVIYRNAANATARLAIGAAGKILSSDGTDVSWGNGPMTTQDDIIIGGASGIPTRLAKGSDSQVLTVDPSTHHLVWATASSGFSDPMTTRGDIIIRNASNVTDRLGIGSSGKVLQSDGTDISWQTPSSGSGTVTTVKDEGSNLSTAVQSIDFVGAGVTATGTTAVTVTIPGGGSSALTLLSETVLGSAAADITVTGISSSYKDLIIVCRFRSTNGGAGLSAQFRFGAGSVDSGSNYLYYENYVGWATGNNNNGAGGNEVPFAVCPNSGAASGAFGYAQIVVMNYADTAKVKGFIGQSFSYDGSGIIRTEFGGAWKNTSAAMDRFFMKASAGNLDTGSAVTIYERG